MGATTSATTDSRATRYDWRPAAGADGGDMQVPPWDRRFEDWRGKASRGLPPGAPALRDERQAQRARRAPPGTAPAVVGVRPDAPPRLAQRRAIGGRLLFRGRRGSGGHSARTFSGRPGYLDVSCLYPCTTYRPPS